MTKHFIVFFLLVIGYTLIGLVSGSSVRAIYDPLTVPNNRIGVHILAPSEVYEAAKLVNSSGGDWGYVTIPIRADDKKPEKWAEFFKNCRQLHLIPIIRLTTYVDKEFWETPTVYDLVDFANFLNDMPWPTNNRYIVLFNEPNHSKEWGGHLAPGEYAKLLVNAENIFKSRSEDFFMLTGGLDMSAPTNRTSLDALSYYRQMTLAVPKWIDAVDGLSFHAYPNPAFSAPVLSKTRFGPKSYQYELRLLASLGLSRAASLPIFITETGTHAKSGFYSTAINQVWTESNIIAITPFILFAGSPDFQAFSLLDLGHQPKPGYNEIKQVAKQKGSPLLNATFPASDTPPPVGETAPVSQDMSFLSRLSNIFNPQQPIKPVNSVTINDKKVIVDIADTPATREQGLSGRPNLDGDVGMVFIFPQSEILTFWMKDMNFALDIIWLNDGKVVGISENVPPPGQTNGVPKIVSSGVNANQVLEVNAGFAQQHDIKIGDTMTIQK